jgi:enterochelin esterase family protein
MMNLPQHLRGQSFEIDTILKHIKNPDNYGEKEKWKAALNEYNGPVPFVKGDRAIFIYHGEADSVSIAGDFNGWEPSDKDKMINVENTRFWYLEKTFDPAARLDYKIVLNGREWILDPKNPKKTLGGFGENSDLWMPQYKLSSPVVSIEQGQGKLESALIKGTISDQTHRIRIYFPFHYSAAHRYPVIYFHDGTDYIKFGSAKNTLDILTYLKIIPPVIGVFIDPNDRMSEFGGERRQEYINFIKFDLIPWMDSTHPTINTPEGRAMIGTSLGANISALIAFSEPHLFSKVGFHSPAFRFNDYEALRSINKATERPERIFTVVGTYEGRTMKETQNLVDQLYDATGGQNYIIAPRGHNWAFWADTIGDMLKYLLVDK